MHEAKMHPSEKDLQFALITAIKMHVVWDRFYYLGPAGNRLQRLPNPRPSQPPSALRPVLEKPPPLPPHPPRPD